MESGNGDFEVAETASVRSRGRLFVTLARALAQEQDGDPLASRLCRAFVRLLEADGGAITLAYNDPQRTTLCVTDATADRLEDLQDVLGEGPGPDAFATGHRVRAHFPTEGQSRWPMLDTAVGDQLGTLVVDALPMRTPSSVLGVITVYRRRPGEPALRPEETAHLADAVGAAILQESSLGDEAATWDARDRVDQATGMVVAQLRVAPDDATALMRAFAFSHGLAMDELATEIVQRRQDFRNNEDFRGSGPR